MQEMRPNLQFQSIVVKALQEAGEAFLIGAVGTSKFVHGTCEMCDRDAQRYTVGQMNKGDILFIGFQK